MSRVCSGCARTGLDDVAEHIRVNGIGRGELLFSTKVGTTISRNTYRTRVWLPAVQASGVNFSVRVYDLRHAHASWLLAGGADPKGVMERMGHGQIQTTQKYLHTLPKTDRRNLNALSRIAGPPVPGQSTVVIGQIPTTVASRDTCESGGLGKA